VAKNQVSGDKKVECAYDCLGRRVWKQVSTWTSGTWQPTYARRYVWGEGAPTGGWLLLEELDVQYSNNPRHQYTWGLDLAGQGGAVNSLEGAGGIGGLLAVRVRNPQEPPSSSDPCYLYFHDGSGNVGQLLDVTVNTATSAIVAKYEYDAYGNTTLSSGSFAATNPFRFSTKYWDDVTSFGYWGYRYYSPRLGRWISRDPIEEKGGLNLCAYVVDNPVGAVDPNGTAAAAASLEGTCESPITEADCKNARPDVYSCRRCCRKNFPDSPTCRDACGGYAIMPTMGDVTEHYRPMLQGSDQGRLYAGAGAP